MLWVRNPGCCVTILTGGGSYDSNDDVAPTADLHATSDGCATTGDGATTNGGATAEVERTNDHCGRDYERRCDHRRLGSDMLQRSYESLQMTGDKVHCERFNSFFQSLCPF